MQSLEKRIAALEVQTEPPEPLTIIRRFVTPGQPLTELQGLKDNESNNEWQRQPGETEQAFVERVKAEAWRNEWGVMVLIGLASM
jgi:hypothetical protein